MEHKKKILQIFGAGWCDTYEVMPNGDEMLVHSHSVLPKKHNKDEAFGCAFIETMLWADFCKKYHGSKYAKPTI